MSPITERLLALVQTEPGITADDVAETLGIAPLPFGRELRAALRELEEAKLIYIGLQSGV